MRKRITLWAARGLGHTLTHPVNHKRWKLVWWHLVVRVFGGGEIDRGYLRLLHDLFHLYSRSGSKVNRLLWRVRRAA
jgi:hypothetical protein